MMEDGKIMDSMAKVLIVLLTVTGIMGNGEIMKKTGEGCFFILTETLSKDNFLMALSMEKEFINTRQETSTRANINTTLSTAWEG